MWRQIYLCWHTTAMEISFSLWNNSPFNSPVDFLNRITWSEPLEYNVYLLIFHIIAKLYRSSKAWGQYSLLSCNLATIGLNPLKMIRSKCTQWHPLNWYSAWTRRNEGTWQCSVYVQTYLRRNSYEASWRMLLGLIYYEMLYFKKNCRDNHWPETLLE